MSFVIQSRFEQLEMYESYLTKGWKIEVSDFAYPGSYGIQGQNIADRWLNSPYLNQIVSIHGSYLDLVLHSLDPQIREVTRKRYYWNMSLADELMANYTIFHTNYLPQHHNTAYFQRWIQDHEQLFRLTQDQYRTKIVLENMWDLRPKMIKKLMQKLGTEEISYCLDIAHAHSYSLVDLQQWFETLGEVIDILHLKDSHRRGDELPLGLGEINWRNVSNLVDDYCNNPLLVLEMEGNDKVEQSLHHLDEIGWNVDN